MMVSCFLSDYIDPVIEFLNSNKIMFEKDDNGLVITISSLYDYLKIVEAFEHEHKIDRQNIDNQFFYRGISNKQWELEPSLAFRGLAPFEAEMVHEFIQLKPDEFLHVKSDFDLLSKMQHYGLPPDYWILAPIL